MGKAIKHRLSSHFAFWMWVAMMVAACTKPQTSVTRLSDDAVDPGLTQILSPSAIERYRQALPKFAFERLNQIIQSPDTLWYDKTVMIPTYQDTVGHGQRAPIGMRRNSEGAGLIVPEGRPLFTPDGKTWSFPFAHTAGTDLSTNIHVANFMWLPRSQGKILPVTYWIVDRPQARGRTGLLQWRWIFPKGTMFGEMIFIKDAAGELYLTELRTRERFGSGWATNIHRPFANAKSLATAIRGTVGATQSSSALERLVNHLEGAAPLKPHRRTARAFVGTFDQSGFIDELPPIDQTDLVKKLLRQTTFISVYGESWRSVGDQHSFAGSSSGGLSFFPDQYEAGIIEVRDSSCLRCHKDAQRAVEDFAPRAILYGDIWGSDDIFSFHPFDQRRYSANGNENRSVRPEFDRGGMVKPFDSRVHTREFYTNLREPKL